MLNQRKTDQHENQKDELTFYIEVPAPPVDNLAFAF